MSTDDVEDVLPPFSGRQIFPPTIFMRKNCKFPFIPLCWIPFLYFIHPPDKRFLSLFICAQLSFTKVGGGRSLIWRNNVDGDVQRRMVEALTAFLAITKWAICWWCTCVPHLCIYTRSGPFLIHRLGRRDSPCQTQFIDFLERVRCFFLFWFFDCVLHGIDFRRRKVGYRTAKDLFWVRPLSFPWIGI